MSFPSRLTELRRARNITLGQLSCEIGVSLRALKYYSSGEREPSMSVLIALADYFDVSLDYLTGRTDNPEVNR